MSLLSGSSVVLISPCSLWSSNQKHRIHIVEERKRESPHMEIFLSAVLGELTARSINFIINKCSKPSAVAVEDSLQRALLRAQVIIDEAMGLRITNQAMLRQLDMLRDAMHKGYYALDTFRCQPHDKDDAKYEIVSRSWSLSKISSAKGPCFYVRSEHILEQLREALDRLSSMIVDLNELVRLLTSYPRMYRQPYSMHILLGNCMFGRQMEAERVINFLLHTQSHGSEELEVLPIVGSGMIGKSTLVAHVCKDERVRDHFSEILFLHDPGLTDDELATFMKGLKHKSCMSNSNKDGRLLVVVELLGDLNEYIWKGLYSASKRCMPSGSKIIITSRSNKIVKFGTTQALTLKCLPHESYWYFFKTLTFEGMDPDMHPRHMHVAMEIARTMKGSFLRANLFARLLKENFDIRYWCKVVTFYKGFIQTYLSTFGEHPYDVLNQNRPLRVGRMVSRSECFVIYNLYHCSSQEEVPKIRIQDLVYGSIKPHGNFKVLGLRSQIPPYYSYVYNCEIRELKSKAVKRKHSMKNRVTLC